MKPALADERSPDASFQRALCRIGVRCEGDAGAVDPVEQLETHFELAPGHA